MINQKEGCENDPLGLPSPQLKNSWLELVDDNDLAQEKALETRGITKRPISIGQIDELVDIEDAISYSCTKSFPFIYEDVDSSNSFIEEKMEEFRHKHNKEEDIQILSAQIINEKTQYKGQISFLEEIKNSVPESLSNLKDQNINTLPYFIQNINSKENQIFFENTNQIKNNNFHQIPRRFLGNLKLQKQHETPKFIRKQTPFSKGNSIEISQIHQNSQISFQESSYQELKNNTNEESIMVTQESSHKHQKDCLKQDYKFEIITPIVNTFEHGIQSSCNNESVPVNTDLNSPLSEKNSLKMTIIHQTPILSSKINKNILTNSEQSDKENSIFDQGCKIFDRDQTQENSNCNIMRNKYHQSLDEQQLYTHLNPAKMLFCEKNSRTVGMNKQNMIKIQLNKQFSERIGHAKEITEIRHAKEITEIREIVHANLDSERVHVNQQSDRVHVNYEKEQIRKQKNSIERMLLNYCQKINQKNDCRSRTVLSSRINNEQHMNSSIQVSQTNQQNQCATNSMEVSSNSQRSLPKAVYQSLNLNVKRRNYFEQRNKILTGSSDTFIPKIINQSSSPSLVSESSGLIKQAQLQNIPINLKIINKQSETSMRKPLQSNSQVKKEKNYSTKCINLKYHRNQSLKDNGFKYIQISQNSKDNESFISQDYFNKKYQNLSHNQTFYNKTNITNNDLIANKHNISPYLGRSGLGSASERIVKNSVKSTNFKDSLVQGKNTESNQIQQIYSSDSHCNKLKKQMGGDSIIKKSSTSISSDQQLPLSQNVYDFKNKHNSKPISINSTSSRSYSFSHPTEKTSLFLKQVFKNPMILSINPKLAEKIKNTTKIYFRNPLNPCQKKPNQMQAQALYQIHRRNNSINNTQNTLHHDSSLLDVQEQRPQLINIAKNQQSFNTSVNIPNKIRIKYKQ